MIPYVISKFRGGISDESDKGILGSFKYGYGLDIHSRDDILKCASTVTTIDETVITDLVQWFVPSADGTTYAFGSTGSVYSIAGNVADPAVNFAYNDENGAILGAKEFQASDGVTWMYWATASAIARRDMSTGEKAVPWTNVNATYKVEKISSSAAWHPMVLANGQLMMGNAEGVSTLDFDLNFDPYKMIIRPGNLINALEERDDYLIIGSQRWDKSEEGHIWSWITTALNWVQKKRIPIQGVNAIITAENTLLQGGDDGEIFFSDFVNATPLHAIPGGGKVNPGGVTIENDLAAFGFYGGTDPGIWTYGRRMKNRPQVLNYPYRLAKTISGSTISTVGAVTSMDGLLLTSWGTTDESVSDYGVDMVSSTTRTNALFEGLEFDAGKPHEIKTSESVTVITTPLPAGTSYSLKYKFDKAATAGDSSARPGWKYAVLNDGSTTYATAGSVRSEWPLGGTGLIYEVGIELNSSAGNTPEIQAIVTYFSNETSDHG